LVSVFSNVLDITKREQAEKALKQSEEKFRASFEYSGIGMALVGLDGYIISVNPAVTKILGYSRDELLAKTKFSRITHPEDVEASLKQFHRMLTGEIPSYELSKRYLHKNGDVVYAQLNASLVRDADGEPLFAISQFVDITERKRAEDELARIFNMSLDPICAADIASMTFIKVNPAFTTVLGYSEQELLGTSFLDFNHPDDVEPTRRIVEEKLAQGEKVINFVNRYRRKDGEYIWLKWASHPDPEMGITYAVAHDITQQRRYEQELRERKALLNEVGKIAKIGGWEMDLITREAKWTQGTYDIAELEPGQPIPGPDEHVEWYLPEHRSMVHQAMRALERDDQPLDFEARLNTAKGNIKWCRAQGRAERVDGKAVRLYGTFQDITERKKAEEELFQTQERLRQLMEQSPTAISIYDSEGTQVQVNRAFEELYGIPPGHSVNQYNLFQSEEASRRGLLAHVERAYAGEVVDIPPFCFDPTGPTEGRGVGRARWLKCRIYPLKDSQGRVQNIVITHEDITERKTAEEELQQTQERFRQLMEQSPSVIEIYDHQGTQVQVNQAFEKLWGIPASHTLGQFNIFQSEEVARLDLLGYAKRAYAGEVVDIPPYRFDPTGPTEGRGQGQAHWLKTRLYPLKDSQGRVRNIVVTYDDVSEIKQVEEQTRLLEAQLRQAQKLEAVGTLAGGIAHDFNNILAAIMGYAELTRDDLPPGHPGRDNVRQILKAIWRARDLVRQILNFSRPGEEHQQPMRLSATLREALKLLRPSIPTYIDIRQNLSDEDLLVLADQSQMHQVLMNLCTNAAQSITGAGVIEVGLKKVTLGEDHRSLPLNLAPGDYQMLWVSDSGQGMDQETLNRIFDPFYTTKEPGAGTGMGLSVVHGIVQAHNGAVAVESQPGQGTTFQVYLPVMKEGAAPPRQDLEALPGGSESILLVDDEPALVEVGRRILERLGYQVTTVTSSLEAAELFEESPEQFDLVITDYTMPGLTGTALAERITAARPGTPIIMCTGYSSDHITESRLCEVGIRALVQKPLRSDEITGVIRQVLDEA